MRKKSILFLGVVVALLTPSCEKDFLDKVPYDKKVAENFYSTSKDAMEGLVSVYDILQHQGWNAPIILTEIASDNCIGGSGASDGPGTQYMDRFDPGSISSYGNLWKTYYQGIYRANVFLENVDKVKFTSKEAGMKEKLMAEARFLRAYYYFDLVRIFGNIPLAKKALSPEDANLPQADPAEVYKYIAEDLKYAIETLPAVPYNKIDPANYGRVTKWAAEGLMGRVFLFYTGYYGKPDIEGVVTKADVRTYLDDVIANSGYGLLDKFEGLWEYSRNTPNTASPDPGEDNKETVFAIKYTHKNQSDSRWQNPDGNQWQVMIGCRGKDYPPFAMGWGFATVTPQLYYSFDPDDSRQNASIIHWDTLRAHDPTIAVFDPSDQREHTGMVWKKYMPLAKNIDLLGGNFMINSYADQVIIRYADILLMSAELHLDDNLTLAQNYFEQVRKRAFGSKYAGHEKTLTNDLTGKKIILEERRHEFALEGLRYWDLLRFGLEEAEKAIDGNTVTVVSGNSTPYDVTSVFRKETKGFFPIPQSQITLSNGVLKQNEGW